MESQIELFNQPEHIRWVFFVYPTVLSHEMACKLEDGYLSYDGDRYYCGFKLPSRLLDELPIDWKGKVFISDFCSTLSVQDQKQLPALLSEKFPNLQFIAGINSPIPLLGVPSDQMAVFKMNDTDFRVERVEMDFDNLTPETLLTSPLFGLDSIVSVGNKDLKSVEWANPFKTYEETVSRRKRLSEYKESDETRNWLME